MRGSEIGALHRTDANASLLKVNLILEIIPRNLLMRVCEWCTRNNKIRPFLVLEGTRICICISNFYCVLYFASTTLRYSSPRILVLESSRIVTRDRHCTVNGGKFGRF